MLNRASMNYSRLTESISSLCWQALRLLVWLVAVAAIGLGILIWYSEYDSEKESASPVTNQGRPSDEQSQDLTGLDKNHNEATNLEISLQASSNKEVDVTPKWVQEPIVGPEIAGIVSALGNLNFKAMESMKEFKIGGMTISGPFLKLDFSRLDNLRQLNQGLQSMIRPQSIEDKGTEKVTSAEEPSIEAAPNHNDQSATISNYSSTETQSLPDGATSP